ncbi:MAG: lipoate--protein ligase [Oscillospiraceae bacterium]|nr:lipoate--protein ligase [Oscillospiraceae bacterium]
MPIHYLETESVDPCRNLAVEQVVLENRREGDWLLLWQNANTVVIGLNQNTAEEVDPAFVETHGITVVRRMTGGGAVYHDLGNLNYSFITDVGNAETLSISRFTEPVCRALAAMGVKAETSGRNDIVVDGKKVSGVAQRIDGGRILHHGTLLFDSDPAMIAGALRADPAKFRSKSAKSVRSRVGMLRDFLPPGTDLRTFWDGILRELAPEGILRESLTDEELARVQTLADEKYRSWDWTWGRSPDYQVRHRGRFAGGTLEVRMNVHRGTITDSVFYGDFMATAPQEDLARALCGVRTERSELDAALSRFELASVFGGITKEEVLSLMLGEGEQHGPC